MTITIELPPELEHQLHQRSTQEGRSISELMCDALRAYLKNTSAPKLSAYSLGADLFGRHTGPTNLAALHSHHLADAWEEKHHRAP
ncbi:ribbon-helix-helix protein, CopG family [Lautropia mirabilis]